MLAAEKVDASTCPVTFKDSTVLLQVMSMVSDCAWGEVHLEVELWTRMAGVALRQSEYEMVRVAWSLSAMCIVYVLVRMVLQAAPPR